MSQLPLTNVSFSNIINSIYNSNINSPISITNFYNYSVDSKRTNQINFSDYVSKYRTFLPTDISSIIGWYDANSIINNNTSNLNNLASNIFNLSNINAAPVYNYKFNGFSSLNFSNSGYYNLNNIDVFSKNITISTAFYVNSNNTNIITGGDFSNISVFLYNNNNIIKNYSTIPIIYTIQLSTNENNYLDINLRYNGSNLITNNNSYLIDKNTLNLNNEIKFFENTDGYLSELLIYNDKLTSSNLDIVEKYLASKWWGSPDYLLPSCNIYYNINPPNLVNFPNCLFRFDKPTTDNNITLNNYGNKGSLLNATLNNYYNNYYSLYSSIIDGLIINYNFDDNINNNGSLTINNPNHLNSINYSDNRIRGTKSINLNNDYLNINASINQNDTTYTIMFWYYINSSSINNNILNINGNNIISIDANNNIIAFNTSIPNINNRWNNIAIVITDNTYNLYYNSLIIARNIKANSWIFNTSILSIYINVNKINANYDDFRIYNRGLNDFEIQEVFGMPIIMKSYNNTTGYLFNNYSSINNNSSLLIDYNNFKNIIFSDNNLNISVLFYLTIYNNFNYLNIIHIANIFKICLKQDILKQNYYIEIKFKSITKTFKINYDNLIHSYLILINTQTSSIDVKIDNINIPLGINGSGTNFLNNFTNDYYTNDNNAYLGYYYNNNYNIDNTITCKYLIENFQIYNTNINTIIEYNKTPMRTFADQLYPFTLMKLIPVSNNNIGPSYDNLIKSYLTSNNYWISNSNFLNTSNSIIQLTIPKNGYYNFIASGAAGGNSYTVNNNNGGRGIIVSNNIYLYKYDNILIAIGQQGGNGANKKENAQGGGGGMSVVYNNTSNNIILIAGGGGGNGQLTVGMDATITTSGTSDFYNITEIATNGNGGNSGYYDMANGYGAGGGGFYTNAKNVQNYSGISFNSILQGNNLITNLNGGGLGGFPGGATGGINYSSSINNNYIWGGGGGGGYSGGAGGSAYHNDITTGGGGGGSYDYTSYKNNAKQIISEENNGYSTANGYIKINFITNNSYLNYSKANSNIIKNDIVLLIEPYNINSYNKAVPLGITNIVNGYYCDLMKNSFNDNNSILLLNNSITINNTNNILSLSIWYKININEKNLFILDSNNKNIIENIYYLNNNTSTIDTTPSTTWKFITIIGKFNNPIILFNGISSLNVGTIIGYNRIITITEHINNYNAYLYLYK